MVKSFNEIYRDFVIDGVPSSGLYEPPKPDIREALTALQTLSSGSGFAIIFTTRANLYAALGYAANTMAWVVSDTTTAYNGVYMKSGASGAGSWSRVADLPYSFIVASNSGAGTPNAIIATTSIPVSSSALVILSVVETATTAPITVSFNGQSPLTIKSVSGTNVSALSTGMMLLGIVSGSNFRLLNDQNVSLIVDTAEATLVAATEAIRDQAQTYANAAEASATEAAMYAEMVGAAVYDFNFDSDPDLPGYDWND